MTATKGYYLSLIGTGLSLLLEVRGLKHILESQGPGGVGGVGFLLGGAVIGVIAISTLRYYRQRMSEVKDQQQIDVETFANLAKSNRQKKQ